MPLLVDHDEERALAIVRSSRLFGAIERAIGTVIAAWRDSFAVRTSARRENVA